MSFRDYVEVLEPNPVRDIESIDDIISMNPLRREALIEKLYGLFFRYRRTGGVPRVIDEYNKNGFISKATISDFMNHLSRDITRLDKSEITAKAVVSATIKQKCNPTSWNSIAGEISVSQPTVQDYIEVLSGMYIIKPIYHPNRTSTKQDERKDKKLILLIHSYTM